jgi:hypothetical protein
VPVRLPGSIATAQVLLVICGTLATVGAVLLVTMAADAEDPELVRSAGGTSPAGFYLVLAVLALLLAAAQFTVAARFRRGGHGTRVCAVVLGALLAIIALVELLTGSGFAVFHLIAGLVILGCMVGGPALDWFGRPRHQAVSTARSGGC